MDQDLERGSDLTSLDARNAGAREIRRAELGLRQASLETKSSDPFPEKGCGCAGRSRVALAPGGHVVNLAVRFGPAWTKARRRHSHSAFAGSVAFRCLAPAASEAASVRPLG